MNNSQIITPQYLCIGHLCHDLYNQQYILGGTASYASIFASSQGNSVGIVTSVGKDFQFGHKFRDIQIFNKEARESTLFENIYPNGFQNRIQYIRKKALNLSEMDVPAEYRQAAIVHLCPIADEINFDILDIFPQTLMVCTPQGWMRSWGKNNRIYSKPLAWEKLVKLDIVILSDEDLMGQENIIPHLASTAKILVITHGVSGATVFEKGQKYHFPSFPTPEVDATGAGDVFATAFFLKYHECRDIAISTSFAHVAASFIVEAKGMNNLPSQQLLSQRYDKYLALFSSSMCIGYQMKPLGTAKPQNRKM